MPLDSNGNVTPEPAAAAARAGVVATIMMLAGFGNARTGGIFLCEVVYSSTGFSKAFGPAIPPVSAPTRPPRSSAPCWP